MPRPRKAALLGLALGTVPLADPERYADTLAWPPLVETRYLLADIESVPHKRRAEWLVDLCHTLGQRDLERG